MIQIELAREDVISVNADVLVLKHAQSFYGADESVYLRLVQQGICDENDVCPQDGDTAFLETHGAIGAKYALFLGTPRLGKFSYREIRLFAQRAIEFLANESMPIETLATTVHGAGYGLDIEESFRSMILGFQQGLTSHPIATLKKIIFVERNTRRHEVLQAALGEVQLVLPAVSNANDVAPKGTVNKLIATPPRKTVFVAMPFSENFEDVYQFGIYATVRRCGYVCEKVDESLYAGSIIDRITCGIQEAEFIIADLTEERPNVYLEVGYAWGLGKPVILVAREGQRLHFDLSHHKCLFYRTIARLSEQLERTIHDLFVQAGS